MLRNSLLAFLLLISIGAFAQKEREQQALDMIETRVEYLMQSIEESDVDFTTLFDNLYYFYQNPLNVNNASREDLESFQLLSDYQIGQLLKYREKYGQLQTQYELIHIPGFDKTTVEMVLPFLDFSPAKEQKKIPIKRAFKYGKHELILRHQVINPESVGYSDISDSALVENPNARYLGSPHRLYTRYRFRFGKQISAGITAEKDPGEEFFTGTQKNGFDFYSAHLFLRDLGPIKQLALGDYQLQVGQGLTFWSGFGFRKSPSQTVDVKRYASTLRPYTSSDENNFMRGAAATVNYKFVDFTAFYSNKYIDGNLQIIEDSTADDQVGSFSSLQKTGMHRTPDEVADKDAIHEVIYGGVIDFKFKFGKVGVMGVQSSFSPTLDRNLQHYQRYEFEGSSNSNAGLNYQLSLNKFNLFGEGAVSENGGYALMNGAIMNLDARFKASVLHRYYSKDYQSLYANAFGEKSGVRNESGVYFGAEFLPAKFVSVALFYDMYRFPWLGYNIDRPGTGDEFSGQLTFKPMRKLEFVFLYRHESKDRNHNPNDEVLNPVKKENRNRYRVQMTADVNKFLTLRTRFETSQYQIGEGSRESGFLFYQDFYIDGFSSKLALKFRYALFDTKDYNTRIYAYENDLRYQFYVPAYYLRGSRVYGVLRWKIANYATLNFKIAQTFLTDEESFGSGKDEIQSDTRTDIKTQLILKF